MEELRKDPEPQEEKIPPFRGLYRHVKISVKALDAVIITCVVVILLVVALEMTDPGFTVTFDSKGGTDVAHQKYMYGEVLELPEPPTREGYTFTGWYIDHGCTDLFVPEADSIEDNVTLYAGWEANAD